jgi:mRNA interferase RelE/StbE
VTPWGIKWTPRAEKDLRRLDRQVAERVRAAVRRFAETGQGEVTKLTAEGGDLRLRVGDWRVRFDYDHEHRALIVLRVLPRGRAFRR